MRIVVVSWMLYNAGSGIYVMLWVNIYSYFWEFTSQQISLIVIPMALAGLLIPPLLSGLASGREKKRVAVLGMSAAILVNVFPTAMRLLGIFPANGTALLFWILVVLGVLETVLFLVFDFGLVYGPLILVIFLSSVYAISRYKISRVQHEETVARLEGR